MTTNGQLNDTRGYHIKTTNSTCNMISGFRLIGPSGRGFSFSVQSNFNYCRKVLSIKIIWTTIITKICTPKSVLSWEFASVYIDLCHLLVSKTTKYHADVERVIEPSCSSWWELCASVTALDIPNGYTSLWPSSQHLYGVGKQNGTFGEENKIGLN